MQRRRLGRVRWAAWILGFALLALPSFGGVAFAGPGARGGGAPGGVSSAPFAVRAGFDPSQAHRVVDRALATGLVPVVITFTANSPLFYDAPATGVPALSPGQIAAEYGLTAGEYARAEAYFESRGLRVTHAWPDRLSLSLEGSATAVGAAFATTLENGSFDGRAVTFPSAPPALPAPLAAEVAGVAGLSTGFTNFTLPLRAASAAAQGKQSSGGPITPGTARLIYGVSSLYNYTGSPKYATGETIVLLLWGDGYAPSDLSTFYATDYPSMFPPVRISAYPVDGAPMPSATATSDPSTAPQELTLDLEWSGSLAPGANLDAVYAPDGPSSNGYSPSVTSMTDAFNEAVTGIPGVNAISMSFGTSEGSGGGLEAAWGTDIATAVREHITLLAATGDNGGDVAYSPCSGGPDPEFPAADPYVLAVGGTNPTPQTNALGQVTGIASETAWAGSGGGYSTQFADPAYQQVGSAGPLVEASGHRGLPDVAAAAANNYLYYDGADRVGQGTSFATPLWAGLVAEMDAQAGTSLGFINGYLYAVGAAEPAQRIPTGLVDITSGSNCLGPAGPGWDTATGWGSPRAVPLFADLTASIVNVTLAVTPVPAAPGGSVTVSARVSNQSSGTPLQGIPVLLALTADTSIGPCEGSFGSATPLTNASGVAVASFHVPACYLGSKAVASGQVTGDGLYGSTQTVLAVNLLGYLPFLGPLTSPPFDVGLYLLIMGAAVVFGGVLGLPSRHRDRRRRLPARDRPERGPARPVTGPTPIPATPSAAAPPPGEPAGPVPAGEPPREEVRPDGAGPDA